MMAALSILLVIMTYTASFAEEIGSNSGGPCEKSIASLKQAYEADPKFKELLSAAFANMQKLPPEYPDGNPWIGRNFQDLVDFLRSWCTFLPTVEMGKDNGLKYIQEFAWFYYRNKYGVQFVKESPGREIMQSFVRQRGVFMDSVASASRIAEWLKDERSEKEDYALPSPERPDGGFKSFNDFFTRSLRDQDKSRPQTMPDRDYIISAPTDCIMNSVPQKITDGSYRIHTKLDEALNVGEMLGGSHYAERFIGGTALSCVLMPNTYHHFHSPVNGRVVEARILKDAFFGYDNFPAFVPPSGNVGNYGTDFRRFEHFQRGYFIVDTGRYGYVALVPVGLDTISSITFNDRFVDMKGPAPVKRGDELGHFQYGGSLFIMIFEPNRYKSDAIQVRLGNQIGIFDIPAATTGERGNRP